MRNLIIGMGEIGSALYKILPGNVQTHDINLEFVEQPIDIMHIAFPYSENFISQVKRYQKLYKPNVTIIYSTVAVGTTKKIGKNTVHSPVEGIHPILDISFKHFARWIGGEGEAVEVAKELWEPIVEDIRVVSSDLTEFLKLYSTSKYGINIAMADYAKKWTDKLNADYESVKQFDRDYNKLYTKLKKPQYKRYILDAPEGVIGGHCVCPNAEILRNQMPSKLLDSILEVK